MTTVLQFALLGLGAGTAYTLLSQGLLLVYRGSGAINFGHGAMAMVGAFLFWQLHTKNSIPFLPAFILAVAVVTVLGVVVFQLVMRPLGSSSRLSRIIATLGLLLLFQGLCQLIWGTQTLNLNSFLPSHLLNADGVAVGVDDIVLLGIALCITAILWAVTHYTAIGVSIAGNAENPRAVSTLGWSPNMLGMLTWGLGGALAAVAGIFIAPLTGIDTSNMPLLVIPVLAAVLIGRLSSFWWTFLGAMVIGILQSLASNYLSGIPGSVQATPFVIILLLLVVRNQGLPARSQIAERLPSLGSGRLRLTLLVPSIVLSVVLLNWVFSENLVVAIGISLSWAIVLLSVVVLLGYTGQLSLAQFALGGIAALIAGRMVATHVTAFVPAFLCAVAATVAVGVLFALPAVRARGINLAVVTLGLGVSVSALLFNNASLTGGFVGTDIGPQSLFGIDLDTVVFPRRWTIFVFALFVLCALAVANVRRGSTGRQMIAVRTNERAASALGVSVLGVKLYAFGLAAGVAGIGGILVAFQSQTILYTQFDPFESILSVGYSFIGGVGFVFGAPLGSTLASGGFGGWLLNDIFPGASAAWLTLISGVSVVGLALLNPNGIASSQVQQFIAVMRRLRPGGRRKETAETLPDVEREPVVPRQLAVDGVTVRFGGVSAVEGASLTVSPGEIVGLIGPNGAGKTTLIDTVTGFVTPTTGEVRFDEQPIDGWSVHRRARSGLSRSFQSLELFESSTVRENLSLAADSHSLLRYGSDLVLPRKPTLSRAAVAAVQELGLESHLHDLVSSLPYGQRRLVAIARAIATAPSTLLLDEPAAGLSTSETRELATVVRRLAEEWGIGILVVEHDMAFVMDLCDKVVVLDFGRQIAYGTPAEVRRDPAVINAYLGGSNLERAPSPQQLPSGPVALSHGDVR